MLDIKYVGFDNITYPEWDKSFYSSENIDFDLRFDNLKLPNKLPEKINLELNEEFILVQDSTSKSSEKFNLNIKNKSSKKQSLKKEPVCIDHYLQVNAPIQEFIEA